ncbi:oligopeptide transporter protein [Clavulina sp. PMI_390]|nr:oligopeptide transporter protein [Clavulina sp. PMI_390]
MATAGLFQEGEEKKAGVFVESQVTTSHIRFTDIPFEEFLYHAAIQRRAEAMGQGISDTVGVQEKGVVVAAATPAPRTWFNTLTEHKGPNVNLDLPSDASVDSVVDLTEDEIEKVNASRALRRATWAMVFYLITTDILGPFNAGFAISQVGWVPGIILYTVMGIAALYTGLIIWRLHIRMDSLRFPIRTYGDMAERLFGSWAKHLVTVLQSIQLIVNVGTLCLSNGQGLAQISKNGFCFAVAIVIWPLVGMVIGQIRTLERFSGLANSAVWINLLIIFLSMGFIAHSPPNYAAALSSLGQPQGPVITQAFVSLPLYSKINGIMNMVFAYGGAMIFPEMLAEMRRPMDFWKGMCMAQALIYTCYLMYGCYLYGMQGQFTLPLAYQGVSRYAWQTVGNVLALITGIIAAGLYGNIGLKVIYINIVEGWFKGPRLMSPKGRLLWTPLVFVYWSLAFIVGSAIPQVQNISGLIASVAIMQFTYTFPPAMRCAYDIMTDAMIADGPYVPGSFSTSHRIDSWRDWSRWKRGLFGGRWYYKVFNFVIFLACLAFACLGMWGSGTAIKNSFAAIGAPTSFGCTPPV